MGSRGRVGFSTPAAGWLLVALILCACAGPPPSPSSPGGAAPSASAPKRVALLMRGDPPGFYSKIVEGVPGMDGLQDLVLVGFSTMSDRGDLRPVLAEAVPSAENGQWKLLPDGQMEMTWTLRPNARWHDGVPVTADDFLFAIQLARDKDLPIFRDTLAGFLDSVQAPDARTVVTRWKEPYIWADWLFASGTGATSAVGSSMPLPKHLLEGPYGVNKSNFTVLPYWNQEFVGTGPFKVREYVPSSHALVTANDQYVLGRPKIDEIEVKVIPDSNAVVVNMLAGVVDLTLGRTVSLEQAVDAHERGPIRVDAAPFNLQRFFPQLIDPRPPILADARFRRALLHAINRQELIDTLEAGLTVVPVSILPPNEAYREAEAGVAQYPYDPQRAQQLIEDLGYGKGPDGTMRTAAGEKLGSIEIRAIVGDDNQAKVMFSVADYWQRVGLAVDPIVISTQQNQDRADKATRPAFAITGGSNGLGALGTMLSSQVPRPETNYSGGNASRYASPEYDALYQRYVTTIAQTERTRALAQLLQHFTANLPFLPMYYRVEARLVANRLTNVAPRSLDASPAWDVHLWDVQ